MLNYEWSEWIVSHVFFSPFVINVIVCLNKIINKCRSVNFHPVAETGALLSNILNFFSSENRSIFRGFQSLKRKYDLVRFRNYPNWNISKPASLIRKKAILDMNRINSRTWLQSKNYSQTVEIANNKYGWILSIV